FWLVTATVISGFESMLKDGLLVATMPMVMAIGGMVGSQASTLIVRALSTGSLGKNFYRVLLREGLVSLGLAGLLALIAFANALFLQWWMQGTTRDTSATLHIASVIGLAMAADVVFAALLGASIPNLVRILRIDPALVSTPAVTALTDLTGASIYLILVTVML
ncbi:MAG: magnesium transporter, partial [Planctomycetota bacterium]